MKLMSVMLVLAALLLFFAGAAGIWRPAFLRLRQRRHAAMLTGFAFVIMGFGIDFDPPPGNEGPMGPAMLALWVFCCLSGWGVLRVIRNVRDERRARPAGERQPLLRIEEPTTSPHPEITAFRNFTATRTNDAREMARVKSIKSLEPTSVKSSTRPRIRPGETGSRASFTYADRYGRVTERTVLNWRSEPDYIHGYCTLRGCELTFNKRRIESWTA